jgi:hypothetical protein
MTPSQRKDPTLSKSTPAVYSGSGITLGDRDRHVYCSPTLSLATSVNVNTRYYAVVSGITTGIFTDW